MICLVRRWSLPAALVAAVLGLAACAGSSSPVPLVPGQMTTAGFNHYGTQLRVVTPEGMPMAATCPKKYLACATVSLTKGLVLDLCYGPSSDSPCSTTKNYKWSGDVCLAKARKCAKIEQMTAAWTGPFRCSKKPKACGGVTKGDYVVDTISIGKTPPKKSQTYLYKQAIDLSGNVLAHIGLNVGP